MEGSWRRVLPAFARVILATKRRRPTFVIQVASRDTERRAAHRIIKRAHYLKARDRGFVLLALIQDPRRAQRIRSRWWAKLPREVKARYRTLERATGGTGQIVGALQLERLVHGNRWVAPLYISGIVSAYRTGARLDIQGFDGG